MRLGNTFFDPYIAILDSKRFELATSDDTPLLGQDGVCFDRRPRRRQVRRPGPRERLRRQRRRASIACTSARSRGRRPSSRPAASRARRSRSRFLGDPAGEIKQKVKLPADAARRQVRRLRPGRRRHLPVGDSVPPHRCSATSIEVEPNNDAATGHAGRSCPCAFNGVDRQAGRHRLLQVHGQEGAGLRHPLLRPPTRLAARPGDVPVPLQRRRRIVGNDDAVGPDSYFRFTVPEDREYVISVTDHLGKGGPNYFYRVEFTPVQPRSSREHPEGGPGYSQERQTIAVPRGNRYATLVNAAAADFGGDLVLGAEGLPAGVTMPPRTMPPTWTSSRSSSRRRPTLPSPAAWPTFTARHADPKQPRLPSGFARRSSSSSAVRDSRVYWKHDVDQARRRRHRRGAVQDQHRRAEGAAGAERLDEPEDRRRTQARLQGPDHDLAALQSARRRLRRDR